MFVNPETAIEQGWITHPECETLDDWKQRKFVSPNGIDFTVDHLYETLKKQQFIITEYEKQMRGEVKKEPAYGENSDLWAIEPNETYGVISDMYVSIPNGHLALLFPRSTFVRNGLFISSGVFDTGFHGNAGCTLHNRSGEALVGQHTRIGQIAFIRSDKCSELYNGSYNQKLGTILDYQYEE